MLYLISYYLILSFTATPLKCFLRPHKNYMKNLWKLKCFEEKELKSLDTMSHLVLTTHTSFETNVIPSLERQRFVSCTMSHFTYLVKYNKLLKMLHTSAFVCHHSIHFSMLHNGYLDIPKAMSNGLISKITKHYSITLWWHPNNHCRHRPRLNKKGQ